MTHGIISTLSIAAIGLLASRISDLFRDTLKRHKPCEETGSRGGAWSFDPEAGSQSSGWQRVGPQGTC